MLGDKGHQEQYSKKVQFPIVEDGQTRIEFPDWDYD